MLGKTDHPYYCNESNYHSNESYATFETVDDFLAGWGDADPDFNLVFRFDIDQDEEDETKFSAKVFFILQRKGNFYPVTIESYVPEKDSDKMIKFLKPYAKYMKELWKEIPVK